MLKKLLRTIQRWWARYKRGETFKQKTGAGRPSTLSKSEKNIIFKSFGQIKDNQLG